MVDLNIDVTCGLNIDKDTADLALRIVNMYCNKNGFRIKEEIDDKSMNTTMKYASKFEGCFDCCGEREYVCYTKSGTEKPINFCPTCGRRVKQGNRYDNGGF